MRARILAAPLAAAILLASPALAGPLEDGINAFDAGEFRRAMELLLPVAEEGAAEAQFYVGQMHDFGRGVVQDDWRALEWYDRAARLGHGGAQFGVARMFDSGESIPQQFVESYAWASVAADQDVPGAAAHRDLIGSILTARELARATDEAAVFWERYVFPFRD